MKPKHKQYKIGTGILPEKIKWNHCQKLLNQTIYSIRNIKVGTIEYNQEAKKRVCFNQDESFIVSFVSNEPAIFNPSFIVRKGNDLPKIIKENNLVFVSIVKNGLIVTKKVTRRDINESNFILKNIPSGTNLIIDKENGRLRLTGNRASSEWISIDNLANLSARTKVT